MRKLTYGFHGVHGASRLAEDILASYEELCSLELVGGFVTFLVSSLSLSLSLSLSRPFEYRSFL
jgi:hypothetical protein